MLHIPAIDAPIHQRLERDFSLGLRKPIKKSKKIQNKSKKTQNKSKKHKKRIKTIFFQHSIKNNGILTQTIVLLLVTSLIKNKDCIKG
jgi:hypothetical protein